MQFIWIGGPVERIQSFELTAKKLLVIASFVLAVVFFVITSLNLIGARAIFEFSPDLVHRLGGLVTAGEQQAREAQFNAELSRIRTALSQAERELQKAEEFKSRLQNLVSRDPRGIGRTSGASDSPIFSDSKPGGRGGPFIPADPKVLGRDGVSQPGVTPSSDVDVNGLITPEVRRLSARAERLKGTADQLAQAWVSNFELLSGLPLAVPVDYQRADTDVTSGFGYRRDPFNGQRAFHAGLDFSAPPGTPVYATADGIVIEVSNSPGGYGRTVIIEHSSGFMTLYAHMSSIRVRQGERVKRHTVIGGIGSTGRSTGPHLHYEVLSKSKTPINPKHFLSVLGDSAF